MMSFEEQINQPLEDPFVRQVEDVDTLGYSYTRAQVIDLLKREITDPGNQPRWVENDLHAYWERPISAHHFVAYHILRGKPWDHGLTSPSPRLMDVYSPMGSLIGRVEFLLARMIAHDIMKQQMGVDHVPRLATTPESIRIRETSWKIARAATTHCAVVAWVTSKIPDSRGQYRLGLSLSS